MSDPLTSKERLTELRKSLRDRLKLHPHQSFTSSLIADDDMKLLLDALDASVPETTAALIDWRASHAIAVQQRDQLASWIVRHPPELPDHACPQCMPHGGDLVKADFVCSYHLAQFLIEGPVVKTTPSTGEMRPGETTEEFIKRSW